MRTVVRAFRFEGNTVFGDAALTALLEPYLGLRSGNELLDARDAVTAHYQAAGYVTSGALLPDQDIEDGVVRITVVEGRLDEIVLQGETAFAPGYLRSQLEVAHPLNIEALRERIDLLTRDPHVDKVDARLGPGQGAGKARLSVAVSDAPRFTLTVQADNHRSPAVGAERVNVWASVANILGRSDELTLSQQAHSDFGNRFAAYSVPITVIDTRLALEYERNDSRVEAEPFNVLDIESKFDRYALTLVQPVVQRRDESLFISVGIESRRTRTFLAGRPFDFSPGVPDNGRTKVVLVRFGQDWVRRTPDDVLAVSSQLGVGINWLGATTHEGLPDGRFFAWLGQAQWVHRLEWLDAQVLTKVAAQFASDALLPSEKIAIGGRDTVRGYRESTLTRDNAVIGSVELRVPVGRVAVPGLTRRAEEGQVLVAGFIESGRGWEKRGGTPAPRSLSSVGLGLLWSPAEAARLELYWGAALREVDQPSDWNLQDAGLHFAFTYKVY